MEIILLGGYLNILNDKKRICWKLDENWFYQECFCDSKKKKISLSVNCKFKGHSPMY